jgi:hypothetical protein
MQAAGSQINTIGGCTHRPWRCPPHNIIEQMNITIIPMVQGVGGGGEMSRGATR